MLQPWFCCFVPLSLTAHWFLGSLLPRGSGHVPVYTVHVIHTWYTDMLECCSMCDISLSSFCHAVASYCCLSVTHKGKFRIFFFLTQPWHNHCFNWNSFFSLFPHKKSSKYNSLSTSSECLMRALNLTTFLWNKRGHLWQWGRGAESCSSSLDGRQKQMVGAGNIFTWIIQQ